LQASLDQLSSEFLESFRMQQQTDSRVQEMQVERSKLPVYNKRRDLMEAIGEHQIILVKVRTA